MNTLYYGDNLKILREYIATESVDLIYLDPPFNSNRNYNVLFKNESGVEADSQIRAFDDTWHWNLSAAETYNELISEPDQVGRMLEAFKGFVVGQGDKGNQMMAYLVMMAVRLKELHRVLKRTGSLYLHCDPTASHYLKILLDTIFGVQNYRNEITWKRKTGSSSSVHQSNKWGVVTDTIFYYVKSDQAALHPQYNFAASGYQEYVDKFFKHVDEQGRRYRIADLANPAPRPNLMYEYKGYKPPANGWAISREKMEQFEKEGRLHFPKDPNGRIQRRRFLEELKGKPVQNLWDDIEMIGSQAQERLGYPTQKPVALLERIISASSNEGDVVLDPFCGCGTTIAAAQKLNREWIGIDITHLSVGLQKLRLLDNFGMVPVGTRVSSPHVSKGSSSPTGALTDVRATDTYQVIGQPEDLDGARELANTDRYDFQWWILPLIGARSLGAAKGEKQGKKGADSGIDGLMVFIDDKSGKAKKVIVSVKSGHVNVAQVRDLAHVVTREKAAIGVFLTLEPPTKPMVQEALNEQFYYSEHWNKNYPKIQILTVEDILNGKTVNLPGNIQTFKKAGKIDSQTSDQHLLSFD